MDNVRQSLFGSVVPTRPHYGYNNIVIRLAKVIKVYNVGNKNDRRRPGTVDVRLWERGKLSGNTHNCFVAQRRAGYRKDKNRAYGKVEMPRLGDTVLVLFIDGVFEMPVVFMSLYDIFDSHNLFTNSKITDPADYEDREIEGHESGYWEKIDKNGNKEISFPDGSFIQITNKASSTPPDRNDISEKLTDPDQAMKQIVIGHASGTWVRINADGSVVEKIIKRLDAEVTGGEVYIKSDTKITLDAPEIHLKSPHLITDDRTDGHTHDLVGVMAGTDTVPAGAQSNTDKFS